MQFKHLRNQLDNLKYLESLGLLTTRFEEELLELETLLAYYDDMLESKKHLDSKNQYLIAIKYYKLIS
jgi:hypothetical protein